MRKTKETQAQRLSTLEKIVGMLYTQNKNLTERINKLESK